MDLEAMVAIGSKLTRFLRQFEPFFRSHRGSDSFKIYVEGQLSDLERKSIEPIADAAGVEPRNLQLFLSQGKWDEEGARDKIHEIVGRKHSDGETIGVIDETSFPKKGPETACVQRQYCGTLGKVENCVVSVHLAFACDGFHTLLDSSLYFPRSWADDLERREKARIPADLEYRPLHELAIGQVRKALDNGVRLDWITSDERYGEVPKFLETLEKLDQRYVVEVPKGVTGWTRCPRVLERKEDAPELCVGARKFPRLSSTAAPPQSVLEIVMNGHAFRQQEWVPYHIKDTHKGPEIWEVKSSSFFQHRDGLPSQELRLIVARNVLDGTIKIFVSNAPPEVPIETLLRVAFSRWRVERCFQDSKSEVGMDHFEVRIYASIVRHLLISMVSHLFLAEQQKHMRPDDPEVTIPQIHDAMETLIDVADLPPSARNRRIAERLRQINTTQHRNRTARESAIRKRITILEALGYRLDDLPTCKLQLAELSL